MKILFLAAQFYPARGGVQKHVYELSQELIKKGYSVTVITEVVPGGKKSHKMIDGIEVFYKDFGPRGFAKKFRIWLSLLRMLPQFIRVDVVHCHDVFIWYLPLRLFLPFKKVYTTFHGYETVVPPEKKAILIRRMSNILSHGSIHIGNFIKTWYGTHATKTLYGGVHIPESIPRRSGKKLKILLLGRLEKDIGIDVYEKVFKTLNDQKISYTLDICGDGSYAKSLKKYGTVHGFVEDPEKYIQKTDIVCASSYLSIMEALAYKKHVCAVYENPLKKDYLTDSPFESWICISDNPQEIAAYIVYTQQRDFQLEYARDIEKYVHTHTWYDVADQYLNLWQT